MTKFKRSISMLVMLLFLFQFSAPLIQTGMGHTPPECEALHKDWKDKSDKYSALILEQEELRNSQAWKIAKEAVWGATIGSGIGAGASGIAEWLWKAGKNAIKRATLIGGISGGVWSAINTYREIKAELERLDTEIEKSGKEADEAWKKYMKCLNHSHASGSLSPYMNSPTNVRSGESHSAHLSATEPFQSVYWYVRAPGESGLGTQITTDTGDGSKTDSYFSYTPQSNGTYTITAYTYFTNTISEPSYDITVSLY